MGKLIIPAVNERQKAMFAHLNIKLIESITEKEFKNVIKDYYSSLSAC